MDTTAQDPHRTLLTALTAPQSSPRLPAGTRLDPALVGPRVARCRTEPAFFVRDMLAWALTRQPADLTVPPLLAGLGSTVAQARSQAAHTLSKIGDARAWDAVRAG